VTIPAGSGLEEIAALLEQKGVVAAAAFAAEVHRRDLGEKLKAGSYYLPAGDVQEIIRRLTR
jgi:cell division protein YceG involved in septum cleavage